LKSEEGETKTREWRIGSREEGEGEGRKKGGGPERRARVGWRGGEGGVGRSGEGVRGCGGGRGEEEVGKNR